MIAGTPSRTMPALAVVPPMSNEITSPAPSVAPDDAGGDHARGAARLDRGDGPACRERAAESTPPLDSMISTGHVMPDLAQRGLQPGEVRRHHRRRRSAHIDGRHRPLVLAHLGPDLRRADDVRVRERSAAARPRARSFVRGVGVASAGGTRRRAAGCVVGDAATTAASRRRRSARRATSPAALIRSAHLEGHAGLDERRRRREQQVVAVLLDPRLAAEPQHVAEPSVVTNATGPPGALEDRRWWPASCRARRA